MNRVLAQNGLPITTCIVFWIIVLFILVEDIKYTIGLYKQGELDDSPFIIDEQEANELLDKPEYKINKNVHLLMNRSYEANQLLDKPEYKLNKNFHLLMNRSYEANELLDNPEYKLNKVLQGIVDRSFLNGTRCPNLPDVLPFPEPTRSSNVKCRLEFLGYNMSTLENYFYSNIHKSWVTGGVVEYCRFMANPQVKKSVEEFVVAIGRYREMKSLKEEHVNRDIFSTMQYRIECEGEDDVVFDTYIEPLIGMTRHPWAYDCKHDSTFYLMNKSYILTQTFEDNPYYSRVGRAIKYIGMDLGASLWLGGSQDFLNLLYDKKGRKFDKFMMWEGTKHTDEKIWRNVPPRYRPAMEYYNEYAVLDINSPENTFRVVFQNITVEDFFAWKLDIDNPEEMNFPWALLHDSNARAIVDEFFFEHHTTFPPMERNWAQDVCGTLEATYKLFIALRMLGIRAHGWV